MAVLVRGGRVLQGSPATLTPADVLVEGDLVGIVVVGTTQDDEALGLVGRFEQSAAERDRDDLVELAMQEQDRTGDLPKGAGRVETVQHQPSHGQIAVMIRSHLRHARVA